jgi:hypothetical protein
MKDGSVVRLMKLNQVVCAKDNKIEPISTDFNGVTWVVENPGTPPLVHLTLSFFSFSLFLGRQLLTGSFHPLFDHDQWLQSQLWLPPSCFSSSNPSSQMDEKSDCSRPFLRDLTSLSLDELFCGVQLRYLKLAAKVFFSHSM